MVGEAGRQSHIFWHEEQFSLVGQAPRLQAWSCLYHAGNIVPGWQAFFFFSISGENVAMHGNSAWRAGCSSRGRETGHKAESLPVQAEVSF